MADMLKRLLGVDDAHAELARLRSQVMRTEAEIAAEEARPVPPAEIETRIEQTLTGLRAQAERLVMAGELARAGGGPLVNLLGAAQVSPMVVAAIVAPGPLIEWLREQASVAAQRMGKPIDTPTRTARLAELHAKLDKLERDEAELLWSADEKGLELPWRPDLSPAAVLGLA